MSTRLSETAMNNSSKISINRRLTANESEEALCKVTGAIKKKQNTLER